MKINKIVTLALLCGIAASAQAGVKVPVEYSFHSGFRHKKEAIASMHGTKIENKAPFQIKINGVNGIFTQDASQSGDYISYYGSAYDTYAARLHKKDFPMTKSHLEIVINAKKDAIKQAAATRDLYAKQGLQTHADAQEKMRKDRSRELADLEKKLNEKNYLP